MTFKAYDELVLYAAGRKYYIKGVHDAYTLRLPIEHHHWSHDEVKTAVDYIAKEHDGPSPHTDPLQAVYMMKFHTYRLIGKNKRQTVVVLITEHTENAFQDDGTKLWRNARRMHPNFSLVLERKKGRDVAQNTKGYVIHNGELAIAKLFSFSTGSVYFLQRHLRLRQNRRHLLRVRSV